MAKKNNKGYLLAGAVVVLAGLLTGSDEIEPDQLDTIEIIARTEIKKIGTRNSDKEYRIFSTTGNSFVITTAGGIASGWNIANRIHANDTLEAAIRSSHLNGKHIEDATVYALRSGSQVFYTLEDFNEARQKLDRRWNILFFVIGALLLLTGLTIIPGKMAIVLGVTALAAAIVLRILKTGY